MHAVINLKTEGVPQGHIDAGLKVLNRLGGHRLEVGLCDTVYFMEPAGSIRGGIQCQLVGGLILRVYECDDGLHEVRITMPWSRRVCVMDKVSAGDLPGAFLKTWDAVADCV